VYNHMKFLKKFDFPEEFSNQFTDIFMFRNPKEYLDQLKPNDLRIRANTYMETNNNTKGTNK